MSPPEYNDVANYNETARAHNMQHATHYRSGDEAYSNHDGHHSAGHSTRRSSQRMRLESD